MLTHVLFDFDGTLMDTNQLVITGLRETVRNVLGREMSQHDLMAVLGKTIEDQMRYFDEDKHLEMALFYKQYYRTYRDTMVTIFPQIDELLRNIKQSGCKTAITSAKGRGGIIHGLEMFDIKQYIDFIVSAYDVENNKPHPECIYKALDYFQCNKESMILIGDSPYDIQCGINAGIKTALVSWTLFPSERFEDIRPDYIVKHPLDILSIIEKSE